MHVTKVIRIIRDTSIDDIVYDLRKGIAALLSLPLSRVSLAMNNKVEIDMMHLDFMH